MSRERSRTAILVLAHGTAAAVAIAALGAAAQEPGDLARLGVQTAGTELPSIGRVLLALGVTVALAVAAAYALRRFWPFPVLERKSGASRVSAQLALSSSLKLHVVELGETTLVVAESRGGVAVAELTKKSAGSRDRNTADAV